MAEQEWSTIPASQALPEINQQNKSDLSEPGGAISEPGEGTTEPPVQPTPSKRGKRKPASGAKASRPRQAKQHQAGTGFDNKAASSSTRAKQKQSTRAKSRQEAGTTSAAGSTRTARSRKKQVKVAAPLEPAHEFEPDVDTTPVKPRETSKAERRTALFSDADPEALPEENGGPFQAEETLKRPIARLHAPPDELPSTLSANGHRLELPEPELDSSQIEPQPDATSQQESVEPSPATDLAVAEQAPGIAEIAATPLPDTTVAEQQDMPEMPDTPLPGFEIAEITEISPDIPETPVPPTSAEESIPETSFSIEEDTPPFLQDELFGVASMEPAQPPVAIAALDAPPVSTPAPVEIELVEAAASPVIVEAEIAPPAREEERKPPAPSKRRLKGRMAIALLVVLALCSIALWRDVSDTHLYLYSINPLDGQVQAQQDLGGGYAHTTALTNPVLLQSSLLVGLPEEQRILSLTGGEAAWNVSRQVSAPLAHATLNVAPTQSLVIAYAGGVQVLTPGGKLLWQARGDGPALGAHAFAPAFDDTTLYTVKDARGGVIAAYDLRSGTMRWSQRLDDSFAYAPPLLLYGNTLFAAGNHTFYALNRTSGHLLWKASAPVRTLLIDKAGQPLLIAAGAAGLQAFDVQSGRVAWSFNGRPGAGGGSASLTVAQFYQAGISATNDVVYATGIVWDEQSARAQLWLYAVDASSGGTRWSEQISSDFASVDAGRVLALSVDATLGMVLLEVARGDGSHVLAAYNTSDGSLRWSTQLAEVMAFAPDLLQAAKTSINVFSVQADAGTALHNWSWLRLLLLMLGAASILLLLGLWLFPLESWPLRAWAMLSTPLHALRTYFKQIGTWRRYSRRARLLVACGLIALLLGASFLTSLAISRPQQYLNAVAAGSGSLQWQHALDTPSTLSGAGNQESFVVMKAGSALSFLSALNGDGSRRWSTPASEGTYSLPAVQTAPGTLLVALSGPTSLPYTYAPADPAYSQPLAHLFTLSLRESATGRVLWQSALVRAGEAQDTTVLASDAQYTYVASRSIPPSGQTGQAAVVQLIAVDMASGAIAWRFFGAREEGTTLPDFGAMLPHGRLLFWQVDSTVYAIDTQLGQIQWRRPLAEVNATSARLEEAQMALTGNVLLVRRSDRYHALDAPTGNLLWSASGLGSATALSPGGILATGDRFILYGNGTIEALDASSHALLWRHDNLANIPEAVIAADGSFVYAIVFDIQDSPTPRQALVAFDVKDSAVRWTFQPSGQVLFVYPGAPQLRAARGMLYVTLCLPQSGSSRCDSQVLYGINGATGAVAWKFGAGQVSAVQVSQGGSAVVFQTSSSPWENFKARFQG